MLQVKLFIVIYLVLVSNISFFKSYFYAFSQFIAEVYTRSYYSSSLLKILFTQKRKINNYMELESFSHGQIQSKQWLCEQLEPYLPNAATICVPGSWHNVLAFMLLTRNPNKYRSIVGIDVDPSVKTLADNICQAWMISPTAIVNNVTQNANSFNYDGYNAVINCSVEHFESDEWFRKINPGTIVCIQSSNVDDSGDIWKISRPNKTYGEFVEKYPLTSYYFSGTKEITYDTGGYSRFMIIGIK